MEARRHKLDGGCCVRVVGREVEGDLEGETGVGLNERGGKEGMGELVCLTRGGSVWRARDQEGARTVASGPAI